MHAGHRSTRCRVLPMKASVDNNASSVPPLDPATWDLAAMKLRILIVTRGRTAVETYKWWRCRRPLNLHVDRGVRDCPSYDTVLPGIIATASAAETWALSWSQTPQHNKCWCLAFYVPLLQQHFTVSAILECEVISSKGKQRVVCGSGDLLHLRQHPDFGSAIKKGNGCTQAA